MHINFIASGIFCLLLACQGVTAQPTVIDSSTTKNAAALAIQLYMQQTSRQWHLFNGVEYITGTEGYIKGHPYFESDLPEEGSILYDHINYPDVALLYDIFRDEVVVEHAATAQKIKLHTQKIQQFTLSGHTFVRIRVDTISKTSLRTGFYDQLFTGRVNVYAKRMKVAQQATRGVTKEFLTKNSYFIEKDHTFFPVKNKSALLKVLNDQKKALQYYLKANNIQYKQDPEYAMVKLAEYYSQLVASL